MGRLALPPGFRFHPTDEELVSYYLKRKVSGRKIEFEAIGDLDLYKFEPWDLPELSRLQTKDLEWYFFCPRDKKYPNGSRTNRATENGYWKATGKDREVASRSVSVGMKKTLVYYKGRAPKGERTNWVMHEYRLEDAEGDRNSVLQNGFVLCRIYQKSGAGPKNGEQYGAPVEEEDWEAATTGEIDSLGATLSSALCSAGASGEIFDTKPSTPKDKTAGQLAVLRTEPIDVQKVEEDDLKFTNLPVEMIAELGERVIMNQPIGIAKACFDSEPEYVSSADLIASFLSPPEGEEDILEEIEGLVSTSDDCNGQVELLNEAETVACFPRDGDFFELDDLSPVLDLDDSLERDGSGKDIWGLDSDRNSWLSRMGLQDNKLDRHFKKELCLASSCDCCYVGAGAGEPADSSTQTQDIPEVEASCTTCIGSSFCQAGDESDIERLLPYAGVYGAQCESCGMGGNELEYGDVLQFFEQFSTTSVDQRESFNAEIVGGTLLPTSLVQAESSKVADGGTDQDEQFLDAFMSFPDLADENVQSLGLSSPGRVADNQAYYSNKSSAPSKELLSDNTIAAMPVVNKVTTSSTAGPQPSVSEVKILRAEAQKKAPMKIFDSRGASKALGAIMNCLDAIPSLPANASAMSPKVGTPAGGSISVLASSVDIRAVAIKCACTTKEDASSPCVTCSFAKRGTFVRSLSYTGGRTVMEGPSLSFSALAILGVIWALFWLLMVGGAWKLVGGVYRMVFY